MNIYLDIDGVLLTKDGEAAAYAEEFLSALTGVHTMYWLTTHCKGDIGTALDYLEDKLPADCRPYLQKIQATDWDALKTEAIDFASPFRWFDDAPMQAERAVLERHGCVDSLIIVDLRHDPEQLKREVERFG